MDDNKVAALLEQLLFEFKVFGEGQQILQGKIASLEANTNSLIEDMSVAKPVLKNLAADISDNIKPFLAKVNDRLDSVGNKLDSIENELIKLNPESQAVFLKQAK